MDFKTMTDEQIDSFLGAQINYSKRGIISPLIVKYDDFVQPQMPCLANVAKAHAFVMNCFDVYKDFLKFYRDGKFGTSALEKIQAVDIFQSKFFGVIGNNEMRIKKNLSLADFHSIKEYIGCAMCFERAILTHNLLKLLELDSSLITKNYHTYNLIRNDKSYILFDPTNPTVGKIKGNLVRFASVRLIPNRLLDGYLYGDKDISIDPYFYEAMFGATEVSVTKMVYKGLNLSRDNDIVK